jgi:hypothetical protein
MKQDKIQRIGNERSFYDSNDPDLFIPVVPDNNDDGSKPLVENPYSFEDYQLYYDKDMWKQHKDELDKLGYKLLEHHWLILDNITISIEICLDHLPPSAVALRTAQVDDIKGSPLRIPMNVERWDESLNKYVGGLNYVRIPRNQAQISLVSSMGMEAGKYKQNYDIHNLFKNNIEYTAYEQHNTNNVPHYPFFRSGCAGFGRWWYANSTRW